MSKYDELAKAIVDYELIGYYDLIDYYGNASTAFENVRRDLDGDISDVIRARIEYQTVLAYDEPDEHETALLTRIIDLCREIESELSGQSSQAIACR